MGLGAIGDSRTGKPFACNAYRLKHAPNRFNGNAPPIVPVIYWYATTETGQQGTVCEAARAFEISRQGTSPTCALRVYRPLKVCQVEMIILDEVHRFRPKTFSEIRDVFDMQAR